MYVVLEWDSVARQRILYEALVLSGMFRGTIILYSVNHYIDDVILHHYVHLDLNFITLIYSDQRPSLFFSYNYPSCSFLCISNFNPL